MHVKSLAFCVWEWRRYSIQYNCQLQYSTIMTCYLQILIYYNNRWRLLLKQFICWIFTLDRLCTRLQFGLFQGCGAVVKMSQLRLRCSSFRKHGSSSGAFDFHECGSRALFFHDSSTNSGFCSFSHIDILIVLMCLKLNGKWIKSSRPTHNQENIPNLFQ